MQGAKLCKVKFIHGANLYKVQIYARCKFMQGALFCKVQNFARCKIMQDAKLCQVQNYACLKIMQPMFCNGLCAEGANADVNIGRVCISFFKPSIPEAYVSSELLRTCSSGFIWEKLASLIPLDDFPSLFSFLWKRWPEMHFNWVKRHSRVSGWHIICGIVIPCTVLRKGLQLYW